MMTFRIPANLKASLATAAGTVLLLLSGCGGSGGGNTTDDPAFFIPTQWPATGGTLSNARTGCDVLGDPALPGGSFTFALTETVDPANAPVPHNCSERIVFAQLYETLVNVACDGSAYPGLAENWTCTEDSTTWVFSIREDARFWDGTRVTAEDVRRAWADNQSNRANPSAPSPWNWINARASSITAVDARRLAIQLPEPQADFPLLLAHPAAAVTIHQPGWTWPVGTGPARLRASDPAPQPELVCRPNTSHPDAPVWKLLTFRVLPDEDLRDLVATDIDLGLTRSLDTVSFFNATPGFSTAPLPWERLYVLVCPPSQPPAVGNPWLGAADQLEVAHDVTSISARDWGHVMFPVGGSGSCPQLSGPITNQRAVPLTSKLADHGLNAKTIAYLGHDPGATELAGRLSHLAGADLRSAGLEGTDLSLALQWQMAGAYIITQDQLFPTGCLQLASLMGRAVWLQRAGLARPEPVAAENLVQAQKVSQHTRRSPAEELSKTGVVRPLALSRSWLITRGKLAGLHLDFDGTPLLSGLGRPVAPVKAIP